MVRNSLTTTRWPTPTPAPTRPEHLRPPQPRPRIPTTPGDLAAQSNSCSYCLSAHSYVGREAAGLNAEQVTAARRADADDAKTAAILRFAVSVNEQRGQIDEGELAAVRKADVSNAEIAEVIGHVALNVLTNYFNNVAHTEIDFPPVSA